MFVQFKSVKFNNSVARVRQGPPVGRPTTRTNRVDAERQKANYLSNMKTTLPIEVDPEIMSGAPVFRGTRVPVRSLFEYLEDNMSLDKFLECFPTVRREDAVAVLEHSKTELLAEAHA